MRALALGLLVAGTAIAGEPPLPSEHCKKAKVPSFAFDEKSRTLTAGPFHATVPAGFSVRLEQPDLAVLGGPEVQGVRTTFEVLVHPLCESYTARTPTERVAARALSGVATKQVVAERMSQPMPLVLGGSVGSSAISKGVAFTTPSGNRKLDLYFTELGDTGKLGLHTVAACSTGECEKSYFDFLGTLK